MGKEKWKKNIGAYFIESIDNVGAKSTAVANSCFNNDAVVHKIKI